MSTPTKTRSFCRECGQQTWHLIAAAISRDEVEIEADPGERPIFSENIYELLHCCGCECVTMRCTTTCEELYRDDTVVRYFPPSTARRRPAWEGHLPPPARFLIREIYDALYSGGLRLAVMGARTLVDMAMLDKIGDVGTFERKLKALEDQGFVSKRNREVLEAALDAGNASAHRGHKFEAREVNQLMDIVENLLQAIYVLEAVAEKIKTVTPPRKQLPKPCVQNSVVKSGVPPATLVTNSETWELRALKHLRKPTTKRPGTKEKLASDLITHLGKKITSSEVFALIEMLSQAGHLVSDDKGKITYHLDKS